jgi:phosphatidylglycerophosphate synthase
MNDRSLSFGALVLQRLREDQFRPRAWVAMLADSWRMSRSRAAELPSLAREWRRLTVVAGMANTLATARMPWRRDPGAAARSATLLLAATATQLADVYVHLGLNRPPNQLDGHFLNLGLANHLTIARGWLASWIWAARIGGAPLVPGDLAFALTGIVATDVLDGPIARRIYHVTQLGGYLDGEADLVAWLALTMELARRGLIPPPLVGAIVVRWIAPLVTGFMQTFAQAEPVQMEHVAIGRLAGAAHVALTGVALAGSTRSQHPGWRRVTTALGWITAGLMALATWEHVARFFRRT